MKSNKWAALAATSVLMSLIVVGCNNKSDTTTNGGTTPTGTTTSTNFGGGDVVATVNGENITRGDMYPLLVAANGDSTLSDLINYQMIMQGLKKSNLEVSDADVDAFLAEHKAQGGAQATQIEQLMKDGGAKLEAIKRRARLQIAMEKLVTKDVKADPATVKTWFNKNQNRYGKPAQVKVGLLVASTKVRADTMLAQLKGKTKTFVQLAEEQKNSSDPAGKSSTVDAPEVAVADLKKNLGPILGPPSEKLAAGGFTPVLALGKNAFGIVGVLSKTPAVKPDFEKLKAQAENDYKLEQVARADLAKRPGGQTLEKVIPQMEAMITQQSAQQGNVLKPSYHDMLGFVTQGKVQEIQTKLRNESKIVVNDPDLKKVADQFKPVPGSSPADSASNSATNSATNSAAPAKP